MALIPKDASVKERKPPVTVIDFFGMKPVKAYASSHGETPGLPMPDLLVGLELEMENFTTLEDWEFGGMSFTEDGSLRNDGRECITAPIAIKHVPSFLKAFYQRFEIREPRNYSERCSTHVHVNVQNLTPEQLSTIALVYQTAERLLFQFIGHDRSNSIFCVPWHQSGLTFNVVNKVASNMNATFKTWQKYSALNLIPVTTLGTLEFRHLHGTCDVGLITTWLCIIAKMVEYAHNHSLAEAKDRIVNMNTVSNYREWLYNVFGQYADMLTVNPNFETQLSRGVVDSKLMLAGAVLPPAPQTFYDPREEQDRQRGEAMLANIREPQVEAQEAPRLDPLRGYADDVLTWVDPPGAAAPHLAARFGPGDVNWAQEIRRIPEEATRFTLGTGDARNFVTARWPVAPPPRPRNPGNPLRRNRT